MHAFVDGGFRNAELKALKFVRKFLQAVTLADIATVDGNCISFQAYARVESNGLRMELLWPKAPMKEKMPSSFITLWKVLSTSVLSTNPLVSIAEFQPRWNWEIRMPKT